MSISTSDQNATELKELLAQEKATNQKLASELQDLKLYFSEMEATNQHLVSATWRERDMKKKLADTIEELEQTKQVVETQNRRISESINYARRIQLAINPTEGDLTSCFPNSFTLYLPKDIISGDFPWQLTKGEYVYVAAVDCTGHGVPGAMMSMIGNLLLHDITNEPIPLKPSEILTRLHEAVVLTLKQNSSDSNSNDGMDIGMIRIHPPTREIIFSGAHRPLHHLRNGVVDVFIGDKFPIGGMHYKGLNNYTDQSFTYEENDAVFLFTDGFPDQIGGPEQRKLMARNIKGFVEENAGMSMQEMKQGLYDLYHSWKGNNKQIDDILMIGIRF